MPWQRQVAVPALVAVAFVVGVVSLFAPWWVLEAGGQVSLVSPFDLGQADGDQVSSAGVIGVGVMILTGLLCLVGGFALELRGEGVLDLPRTFSAWLVIAGGALCLMAPLVAVLTWPQGALSFWSGAANGSPEVRTRAGVGWFLALIAGGVASVTGLIADRFRREEKPGSGPS